MDNINCSILHTISYKFNGKFNELRKNIQSNSSNFEEIKFEESNIYLKTRFRIEKKSCYLFKNTKNTSNQPSQDAYPNLIKNIFLYRNKGLADGLSNKRILIGLPPFSLKLKKFYRMRKENEEREWREDFEDFDLDCEICLFFLISETILFVTMAIKPNKPINSNIFFNDPEKILKTITHLQKPQDLATTKAMIKELNDNYFSGFYDFCRTIAKPINREKGNRESSVFVSEIMWVFYYFIKEKLNLPIKITKSEYDDRLDIFDTSLYTSTFLFIPDNVFDDPTFRDIMPNMLYGYSGIDCTKYCKNKKFPEKENISLGDDCMFFYDLQQISSSF